ncbi:hypothetical protein CC86DRAFT_371062 [Ophiobolus disseminans]|uniref:DNA-binding protein RAP1 n=1 Tax=Ophiobolus disseminans TaxID=1469910 RepID=A0A6A6ZXE3_9PLEO|nr:hypothetical protein CC86DRAFT_371062 [Ophiobolus disseminans]
MAAPTVYENVADVFDVEGVGQLFAGKKFWVAQRMPSRIRLIEDIQANGGEIVKLEKQADYMIADHIRKDCPPGSISYEFVDKSIKEGRLRDPQDHRAGPQLGEAREPGAINRPVKGGRAPYTADEDIILYIWVRDCVANGGSASGNEIYKQLEAKHPRHTWQSWRDRYLKQLRDRPPSAFNIPDNAPPSPPSDHPPVPAPAKQVKKASPKQQQPQATSKVTGKVKVRDAPKNTPHDYTLAQLEATFSSEDWEELYAFVDTIESFKEDKEDYEKAWEGWAEQQENQTAEQWRQYYEKVVRPQWLRDPEWKRKQINAKMEARHEQDARESQNSDQQKELPDDISTTAVAGKDNPPPKASGQVVKTEPTAEGIKAPSDTKLMSSSTVQYESPKYIEEIYQNKLKRVRGGGVSQDQEEEPRPFKKQKSVSPAPDHTAEPEIHIGTQEETLVISSSQSAASDYRPEADDERAQDQLRFEMNQSLDEDKTLIGHEFEETEQDLTSVASDDFSDIDRLAPPPEELEENSDEDLPSNTPTPRASRQRPNNFDTQAILSSPSQGLVISKLPRPVGYTQDLQTQIDTRSSSVALDPESEASTTQSLQEFRHSLTGEDNTKPPLSRSPSFSPTPSTDSGDPDPPLQAHEFDEFYAQLNEEGFSDDFITSALKRTRCRPDLAELVLDAWKDGKPLPNQRGVWSLADDDAVERGDGVELMKLQDKHTLDGWGGITERLIFLDGYRSRG